MCVAAKQRTDEVITNHLGNNWSMQRLAKIDIVILRLAIFEMLYVSDVPNIVALNEAVELSKNTATTVHVNLLMVCYQM